MEKENIPIKIGIIDSGIDVAFLKSHPIMVRKAASFQLDINNKVLGIAEYDKEDLEKWKRNEIELDINDLNGHGTAVLSIIYKEIGELLNPEFSIVKILDETNNSKSICLVEALEWMLNVVNPDYINMSLSASYDNNKEKLYQLTKLAQVTGTEIFCSATGYKSYPAEFDTVITVGDLGLFKFRPEKTKVDKIITEQFVDIFKTGKWLKTNMFTSYACPMALGNHIKNNISLKWN